MKNQSQDERERARRRGKKGREGVREKERKKGKKGGREREISSERVKCVRRDPSALQPH